MMKETNPYNKMFEDRIIFLGVQVDDASANDVMGPAADAREQRPGPRHPDVHQLARRVVHRHDGDLRHDAVRPSGHLHRLPRPGCQRGRGPARGRHVGQAHGASAPPGVLIHQPATEGGYGQGLGHRDPGARDPADAVPVGGADLQTHSGQPLDKVRKDIDRDKIMTANEAKEYGLVDVVLASRKKSLQSVGA